MPNFYYIIFEYTSPKNIFPNLFRGTGKAQKEAELNKQLKIKEFTDIKPLDSPHFTFDYREMEFMLTGQWDMWIKPICENGKLVDVEKIVNCNIALDEKNNYPELYNLLSEYCGYKSIEQTLLHKLQEMEQAYWDRQVND